MSLLEVHNLVKHFPVHGGLLNRVQKKVHAVNGVSLTVNQGEILGVVGESGCGKSTLGKTILRLTDPTSGQVLFDGIDVSKLSQAELRNQIRSRMQIVFQDPYSSLNPRMTARATLKEVLKKHQSITSSEMEEKIDELLLKVGLNPEVKGRYPHEISGGQKQRLGIARALAVEPEFIIADEPISALDVSIQAQILNLLTDLQLEFGLTMMFISHDLKVVNYFCDRMLVMYLGHVVEQLPCGDASKQARHPYTQALMNANPIDHPEQRHDRTPLEGDLPSPYNPPKGCPFVTRCPVVEDRCRTEMPPLVQLGDNHQAACWAITNETATVEN